MILQGETRIRLELVGDGFEIIHEEGVAISPFHLLAGSLASCIALVIVPWAENVGLDPSAVVIAVDWRHGADERVERLAVDVKWPGLPADRVVTVERLAAACPIHAMLHAGTSVETTVRSS